MDRQLIVDRLELAERHVSEGSHHVERQRRLVARLAPYGGYSDWSKALLAQFEKLLSMHIADRDRLLGKLLADQYQRAAEQLLKIHREREQKKQDHAA
jgi:hypothetical protein